MFSNVFLACVGKSAGILPSAPLPPVPETKIILPGAALTTREYPGGFGSPGKFKNCRAGRLAAPSRYIDAPNATNSKARFIKLFSKIPDHLTEVGPAVLPA